MIIEEGLEVVEEILREYSRTPVEAINDVEAYIGGGIKLNHKFANRFHLLSRKPRNTKHCNNGISTETTLAVVNIVATT